MHQSKLRPKAAFHPRSTHESVLRLGPEKLPVPRNRRPLLNDSEIAVSPVKLSLEVARGPAQAQARDRISSTYGEIPLGLGDPARKCRPGKSSKRITVPVSVSSLRASRRSWP